MQRQRVLEHWSGVRSSALLKAGQRAAAAENRTCNFSSPLLTCLFLFLFIYFCYISFFSSFSVSCWVSFFSSVWIFYTVEDQKQMPVDTMNSTCHIYQRKRTLPYRRQTTATSNTCWSQDPSSCLTLTFFFLALIQTLTHNPVFTANLYVKDFPYLSSFPGNISNLSSFRDWATCVHTRKYSDTFQPQLNKDDLSSNLCHGKLLKPMQPPPHPPSSYFYRSGARHKHISTLTPKFTWTLTRWAGVVTELARKVRE